MEKNQTFAYALLALNQGLRVSRAGWNGKDMFVFLQVPATIDVETVVPKMQSLPPAVKNYFMKRMDDYGNSVYGKIHYDNQFALVKPDNTISGWHPSVTDVQATDWEILDAWEAF